MPVNGGVVQAVFRYPSQLRSGLVFAVQGTWSGGKWSHLDPVTVQHYRDATYLAAWQMVGVDIPARRRGDAIILLRALSESPQIAPDDVLIFGEGRYSSLEVEELDFLPGVPKAIQVGPARYNALAVSRNLIVVFHEQEATLPDTPTQSVWLGGHEIEVTLSRSLSASRNFSVEIYLNHELVSLKRLINTLDPLRGFVLDAGQELLTMAPRTRGATHLQAAVNAFEPTVTAGTGSLRIFLHSAQPKQIPLYVKPSDPLRIMVDVLRAASQENAAEVADILAEKFLAAETLIGRLRKVSDTAERFGDILVVPSDNSSPILINQLVTKTLVAGLEIIDERMEVRVGIIIDMVLSRRWLRLQTNHNDRAEEWTLTFSKDFYGFMHDQKLPRRARIVFTTRTPEELTHGKGSIVEFQNLPDEPIE